MGFQLDEVIARISAVRERSCSDNACRFLIRVHITFAETVPGVVKIPASSAISIAPNVEKVEALLSRFALLLCSLQEIFICIGASVAFSAL